jgi:hypothetical protein
MATEEYRPCLTVERKLNGDMLTVEDLERAMIKEYRQLMRAQFCKDTNEGELCYFNFKAPATIEGNQVIEPTNVQMEVIPTKPARQKGTVRVDSNHVVAEKVGERLFLDIAAVFEEINSDAYVDYTQKGYWRIIVEGKPIKVH